MGHVKVPAVNYTLLFFKGNKIGPEIILPLHSVFQALQTILGVGDIGVHHKKVIVLQSYDPALFVVLINPDSISDAKWFMFCKDSCATITLFLSIVEITVVRGKRQIYLAFLQFRLLKAEKICIEGRKDINEVLTHYCSQSIDIPRYKLHFSLQ